MPTLRINSDWIDSEEAFRPEYDQSYGALGIEVDGAWATEFETESGARGNRIEVPSYPLAEWIAENWWSLLHEPEKGDRSDRDPAFRSRHWLGTAREGFALPDAWLYTVGKGLVRFSSEPSYFPHARLILRNPSDVRVRIEDVERELAGFVQSVVDRIESKGVTDTNLQAIWAAFRGLTADEKRFCRLLGALGLSPYDAPPDISNLLTRILGDASERVTEDFCEAADEGDIFGAADDLVETLRALDDEPELDLSRLFQLRHRVPANPKVGALQSVAAVRDFFQIGDADPSGGEAFLSKLGLQSTIYDHIGLRDIDDPTLHGSLRRHENASRINLIRKQITGRRFDAARACYLAWVQNEDGDRLVTRAKVTDQQISRIFAAELLAPIKYIKSRTRNNLLSPYGAAAIAEGLNVSRAVVDMQAEYNQISLVGR